MDIFSIIFTYRVRNENEKKFVNQINELNYEIKFLISKLNFFLFYKITYLWYI